MQDRWLIALIAVIGISAATAVIAYWEWVSDADPTLAWTAATGTLTAGGGALALVAAIVAVLAYRQTTQTPDFLIEAWQPPAEPATKARTIQFSIADERPWPPGAGRPVGIAPLEPLTLVLRVKNNGEVSARNIVVDVSLAGISFLGNSRVATEWGASEADYVTNVGWRDVRWEGGADYAIHGDGDQREWRLTFSELWGSPGSAVKLEIRARADRIRGARTSMLTGKIPVTDAVQDSDALGKPAAPAR